MDSRHDGKRFPGCLKENARPSPVFGVGLFLWCDLMTNPFKSRLFLAFLIVCLALAGQAGLPSASLAEVSVLESFESETDQTEFEDDLLARGLLALLHSSLTASRTWLQTLNFRNLHPAPASPPPKFS